MLTSKVADSPRVPSPLIILELLKPHTWFPPMWAFLCGAVSSGALLLDNLTFLLVGIVLAGPLVCGMSQAANDWCDRHVDAINEPHRPIPSGRMPGRSGLWVALIMSIAAPIVAWPLGPWCFIATIFAVAAAWAYSADPIRLKRSGWWGPGLVALCYEGLPWFTGAAALSGGLPTPTVLALAALYAFGAHGIMTLNDFKAITGDKETGVASLPVRMGVDGAARFACLIMLAPQIIVVSMLWIYDATVPALIIAAFVVGQIFAMRHFLRDPIGRSEWYNRVGVVLFVSGMMVAAIGLRLYGIA